MRDAIGLVVGWYVFVHLAKEGRKLNNYCLEMLIDLIV